MNKHNFPLFIDRGNFEKLQSKDFNILKNYSSISVNGNQNVSLLTTCYLIELNRYLSKLIYNSALDDSFYPELGKLTDKEKKYVEDMLHYNLVEDKAHSEKYYDITVLEDSSVLVIVENGFLAYVMENKENLLKFFLDYLRHSYKYGLSYYEIMKVYLKLKFKDFYFELLKSRLT